MLSTSCGTRAALIGATIAFAIVVPGVAAGQDLRTPDAADPIGHVAPQGAIDVTTYSDVRTPDARDSGQDAAPGEDLRSPDGREAPAFESEPIAAEPSSGGFDLVSAGIGAAAGAGLLIVLMAFLGAGGLTGRHHGAARA